MHDNYIVEHKEDILPTLPWENLSLGGWEQQRRRPACAWSATLLLANWKVSYQNLLQAKFHYPS